jgi:mRNA-degrading endonuclease RelE of RelBE toxin-antitoxin system
LTIPRNAPAYSVVTTAHFDRLLKKLVPKHPELVERFEQAIGILSLDPYNKSARHPIKKLNDVAAGEGQYRLRSGRFRFRYDVAGRDVVLLYCGLRREDTY